MKAVLFLAAFVVIALAGTVRAQTVDIEFDDMQKKVFDLLFYITQVNPEATYYQIGNEYDIEANAEAYTNRVAFEEYMTKYRQGITVSYDNMSEEVAALYNLFYYANDFDTFYKTAAWARVRLNEGLFASAFSIAIINRADTQGIIFPTSN